MKVLRLFWYTLKLLVFSLLGIPFFLVAGVTRIFSLWRAIAIFQNYIRLYFWLFGLDIQFEFSEPEAVNAGNTIFILLNQSSFLDSLVCPIIPVNRIRGILNIEFAFYPVLGWFLALTNFVIVRQWRWQAKWTMDRTHTFLRSGGNMIISIEGRRTHNGKLSEYKKGPVVLAIKNQSDIIPFTIEGTYQSLPYRSLYTQPGNIKVRFLDRFSTKGLKYEDRNDIREKLLEIANENGLF